VLLQVERLRACLPASGENNGDALLQKLLVHACQVAARYGPSLEQATDKDVHVRCRGSYPSGRGTSDIAGSAASGRGSPGDGPGSRAVAPEQWRSDTHARTGKRSGGERVGRRGQEDQSPPGRESDGVRCETLEASYHCTAACAARRATARGRRSSRFGIARTDPAEKC
jgi:hypothetical protein